MSAVAEIFPPRTPATSAEAQPITWSKPGRVPRIVLQEIPSRGNLLLS
jgi:hypothetical protein